MRYRSLTGEIIERVYHIFGWEDIPTGTYQHKLEYRQPDLDIDETLFSVDWQRCSIKSKVRLNKSKI